MAFPQIETGYKPEFALGALYQGMNAANANNMAEEEILQKFLANQREQSIQPLDIKQAELRNQASVFDNMVKELSGAQAQQQNNKPMLQNFALGKDAQNQGLIRKNEVEQAAQPYELQAAPLLGKQKVADANITEKIAQLEVDMAAEKDPLKKLALRSQRNALVDTHGYSPQHFQKVDIENVKGGWDYDRAIDSANIHANATRDAANMRGSGGSDAILKATQSYVNRLEQESTNLAKKLSDTTQIAELMKQDPTGGAVAMLRNRQTDITNQLQIKRAELQALTNNTQQQPQTQQQQGNTIQAQVEAAGYKYEPNLFEYRVVDGRVQRRKKE